VTRTQRSDLPLVGRAAELAEIRTLLAAGGHGVLLAGPAGVGKSRLAREAAAGSRAAGWQVLSARTSGSGTGLALAALAPLLPAFPGGPDTAGGPVQRGLCGLRDRAASPGVRTLLLVDDAHLLDDVSATVVHQAVAEGTVKLLATVRTPNVAPAAVTTLWKDAGVARMDLSALAAGDMDALVLATLDGPVEGRTLRRLRDACAGNPLFLRELLVSAREAGIIGQSGGIWHLSGPLGSAARVSELLRGRLATTEAAERDALELLALGEPLHLPDAAALTGAELLESLERRGLVTVTTGARPTVRLSHPLYGELLRADVPELARRRHSRRLADTLQPPATPSSEDLMRIALWRLDGGGSLDPALMLAAAEEAALVREYATAERLAGQAYRAGGGVAAGLSAVRALFHLGRLDEALELCTELTGVADGDEDRCAVAVQHAAVLVHGADDVAAASDALDRAGVTDAGRREQLDVFRLYLRSYQLDCSVVEPARQAFRTGGSVEVRLAAAGAAGGALMLAGRFAECAALVAEAVPVAVGHSGSGRTQADSMAVALGAMRCDLPDPVGAVAVAQAAYEATLQPADLVGQALTAFSLARIALARGRPATALRWARESRFAAGHLRLHGVCRWASALRLQAAVQLEAADEAADAIDDLRRHPAGAAAVRLFDMEVARGYAWRAAARGDAGEARDILVGEVTRHGECGAVGTGTMGALDLVRLGEPAEAARLLRAYPPPHGWELGAATVAYAGAAAARDAPGLIAVAQRFASYGMPLHAAEAAMLAGALWRAAGDPRAGGRARLLADTQLAGCEDPVTPALRLGGPAGQLTGREREMVLAVAHGESAPAIAARLHLSERTVENHLHRAYTKLGVAGRGELRTALAVTTPDGPPRGS
jgi:DNA-binding CsgD family transcriptional regulator